MDELIHERRQEAKHENGKWHCPGYLGSADPSSRPALWPFDSQALSVNLPDFIRESDSFYNTALARVTDPSDADKQIQQTLAAIWRKRRFLGTLYALLLFHLKHQLGPSPGPLRIPPISSPGPIREGQQLPQPLASFFLICEPIVANNLAHDSLLHVYLRESAQSPTCKKRTAFSLGQARDGLC
ncbi:MAG: hypothetical protein ACYC3I_23465 [Gemmataceae bacterium]